MTEATMTSLTSNLNPLDMPSTATTTDQGHAHDQSLQHLLSVSEIVLMQAVEMLDSQVRTDDVLSAQSKLIPGSTIGKHLRHSRDHFELLLDAIEQPPPRSFSYDTRLRNTPMETSHSAARTAMVETIQRLKQIVPSAHSDTKMVLQAVTPYLQSFETTFGRELWSVVLHTIHHWSMVRVIAGEYELQLDSDFGFAPSTLVYQARNEAALGKANL